METKVKKFSHKLLALFLAVVMALTCFTGVITASAASKDVKYRDDAVEYNSLAWNMLSDEQIATSLLDTADSYLPELKKLEPKLNDLVNGSQGYMTLYNVGGGIWIGAKYMLSERQAQVFLSFWGVQYELATVTVKLGSVDELIETINSVDTALGKVDSLLGTVNALPGVNVNFGDVQNLKVTALKGMSRSQTSSCDIVRGVVGLIHDNADTLIGKLLRGELSLGTLNGALPGGSVYALVGDLLGISAEDAQGNLVYNIVKTLLFNYTEWFTEEEKLAYNGGGTLTLADGTTKEVAAKTFVYDDVLLEKMTVELLDKISVLVTYNDGTSSATRKEAIEKRMAATNETYEEAAAGLGYDPNLIYSTEKGMENNILLFAYGDEKIQLTANDSLFEFGYQALKMAWNTVLKDTVKLIHVNNDTVRSDNKEFKNFDNKYYYWAEENLTWDTNNLEAMYSAANVERWADEVCGEYGFDTGKEFLDEVKGLYEYDRTAAADSEGKWSDIDSTTLFGKVRYSPLADYYFNMQTGSINLYFVQTGTPNLDNFFKKDYATYPSMVAAFNDCLVAAVNDIFVDRDNIYVDAKGDTERPVMQLTKDKQVSSINDKAIQIITDTLVENALDMVQYVADTTDQNILKAFYKSGGTDLQESNLEAAMIPMLISCIGNVNLGSGRLDEVIHPTDWDACKDAEAVAFVCLREYLSHILPERDYNGLVTVAEGKISATLNKAILPMARDAVTFVMDGYVPVSDADGNAWKVEDRAVDDPTTLLQLLNSVVCYYADFYNNKDYNGRTMGIAALLGVCDENGNSLVNSGNNIWKNFDAVANTLFPLLGVLQGNGSGNFKSEELIWNDLVLGILDIGKTDIHKSGLGGVSNFIYRFLSIVSSDPIQNDSVIDTAYEVMKELVNGLFGGRYAEQKDLIPAASGKAKDGARPFDALLQKEVLGGTSGNPGVVPTFFINLTEFTGFASGIDTVLPGIFYALTAVNSFVNILPELAEHSLSMASTTLANDTFTGCNTTTDYKTTLNFKNECAGINNAYVDGMNNGKVNQLSRYYVKPTSVSITKDGQSNGSTVTQPSSALLAPGESINLDVTALFDPAGNATSCIYTIVVNYDVYDGNVDKEANRIAKDLKARDYIYMSNDADWAETIYPSSRVQSDGMHHFNTDLEVDSSGGFKEVNGFKTFATADYASGNNRIYTTYPEYVVLSTDNLSAVNNYAVRHWNHKVSGLFGQDKAVDGIYYFDNKTVMNDATGSTVTVGQANPIPVFDKVTGDLLFIGKYDVSYDGGKTFTERGKTDSEVSSLLETFLTNGGTDAEFVTRTNVAYTLDEAKAAGIIAAYHVENGEYTHVYLKAGSGNYTFDNLLSSISMRGPIDGFYLNTEKVTVKNTNWAYANFLKYDGTTAVQGTTEPIEANICFYNSNLSGTGTIKFVIADTSAASSVDEKLDTMKSILNNYRDTDFGANSATTLKTASNAIENALSVNAMPLTPNSAVSLQDKTSRQFVTAVEASATGDIAYVPVTNLDDIPVAMRGNVYYKSANGVYYADKEFVAPIYSATRLTDADVTDGKDAAGLAVTLKDGIYYHTNTASYEKEWTNDGTYNYVDTNVQATNGNDELLYNQVQFKHYNANGKEVRNNDNWVIAAPETSFQIVKDGKDNRGLYSKASDYLQWTIEYVYSQIDPAIAARLFNEVSLVRNGMNSFNFDVVTYNKMVDLAKTIESKYSIDINYDTQESVVDASGKVETKTVNKTDTISFGSYNSYVNNKNLTINSTKVTSNLSSAQVDEYVRLFSFYMSKVVERGYQGKQLEDEIVCASGNDWSAYSEVTPATRDDDGNITSLAEVKSATATAKFGKFVDGVLVNQDADGNQPYTEESWNNYVAALADAVALAQLGNGSYAHKDKAYYNATANDYDANIDNCYWLDTKLQIAEIALTPYEAEEPPVGDTITISGTVMISTDTAGVSTTKGIVGIDVYVGDEVVATSAADGTFTAVVPKGTTELTFSGPTTIDRTVTLSGTADVTGAIVPIVICDYNKDKKINATDKGIFASAYSGDYNVYCDFNGDLKVNATDKGLFASLYGQTINYNALALD